MDHGTPWFDRLGPLEPSSPLVCSVPHAGRIYPAELLASSAVSVSVLELLEDRYADLLVAQSVANGAIAIVARGARAWIDLNRGEEDLDPALRTTQHLSGAVSSRARSGLGLVPRRVGRHDLWRVPPRGEDVSHRIAAAHRPYHEAVAAALAAARRRFGYAVLIDCHSMPTLPGDRPARIVIGDRHGQAAGKGIAADLARESRSRGVAAAINAPYAGAYTLLRHGRPAEDVHALQIEVDRSLYLDRTARAPSDGLGPTQALFSALARAAVAAVHPFPIAAE